jgi:hypothetical protein
VPLPTSLYSAPYGQPHGLHLTLSSTLLYHMLLLVSHVK